MTTLSKVIDVLAAANPDEVISPAFDGVGSYRGYYEQIAFIPCAQNTVGEMLRIARSANGHTFQGYKGGDYTMDLGTVCVIAGYGDYGGDDDGDALVDLLSKVAGNKDLAVAREMLAAKDAEIAAVAKTLAERDALCEAQTRTINGIPALMRERDEAMKDRLFAEGERDAAQAEVADLRDHLKAANAAHLEAEAEANAAEQMVCELRKALEALADVQNGPPLARTAEAWTGAMKDGRTALALTEIVAGWWVPKAEHAKLRDLFDADGRALIRVSGERDAAIAAKEAAERERDGALAREDGAVADALSWRTAREAAESREHALGVQVVALQKRLALADKVVEAARITDCDSDNLPPRLRRLLGVLRAALAALDAVPGDALAVPKGWRNGRWVDIKPEHREPTVDHLEASGVDVERDPVLSTVRAATSPLDWSDDVERGPYTDEGSNGFVERAGKGAPFDEADTTNPDIVEGVCGTCRSPTSVGCLCPPMTDAKGGE